MTRGQETDSHDKVIWVPLGEALERLRLSTKLSERTINRHIERGYYPTRKSPDGDEDDIEVAISADTPQTLEVQLAEQKDRNEKLAKERDEWRELAQDRHRRLTEAECNVGELRGRLKDVVSYKDYLDGNIRIQVYESESKQRLIDELRKRLRSKWLRAIVGALFAVLITAAVMVTILL